MKWSATHFHFILNSEDGSTPSPQSCILVGVPTGVGEITVMGRMLHRRGCMGEGAWREVTHGRWWYMEGCCTEGCCTGAVVVHSNGAEGEMLHKGRWSLGDDAWGLFEGFPLCQPIKTWAAS